MDTGDLVSLDSNETRELLVKSKEGDLSARDAIVMGNLKLVLSLVNSFQKKAENLDDVFQVGVVGLLKAIDHFDLSKEVRFSTYAVPMILGEIRRYFRDSSFLHVSRQMKDRAYQALRVKEKKRQETGKEADIEEIAQELNLDENDIRIALDSIHSVVSLSEPLYNDFDESLELGDTVEDEEDESEKMLNLFTLKKGLEHLSDLEYQIIYRRFYEQQTQLEIASALHISQAQVSRLEKSALHYLKTFF